MDLTKGKVNDYKNETKLDNAEKELYIKGSKTNESVSWTESIVTAKTSDIPFPRYSFLNGYWQTALQSKQQT